MHYCCVHITHLCPVALHLFALVLHRLHEVLQLLVLTTQSAVSRGTLPGGRDRREVRERGRVERDRRDRRETEETGER